jgi:hypothetical protein
MNEDELIEQVAGAWRPREGYHKAWHDLDAEGRRRAFEVATTNRSLEAALDPEGLSTTARAVLARITAQTSR